MTAITAVRSNALLGSMSADIITIRRSMRLGPKGCFGYALSKPDFGEVCDAQRPATKQSGKEETEEGESAIHSSIAFFASDRKGAVKSLSDSWRD